MQPTSTAPLGIPSATGLQSTAGGINFKAEVQSTVPATLTSTSHVTTAGGIRTFEQLPSLQQSPAPLQPLLGAQPLFPKLQPLLLQAQLVFSQAQPVLLQAQQKPAVSIKELTCQAVDTPVEHL